MKLRLVALCIVLMFVVMLPVIVQAETKLEFEMGSSLKTTTACEVHDGSPDGEVFASLPAGTYVRHMGAMPDGWIGIQFWYNGGRAMGYAQVKTVAAMSNVRQGNGMLDQVHELDPDYEAKMQQGTAESDVRGGWSVYEYDDGMEHISPEEAAARVGQYSTTGSTTTKSGTASKSTTTTRTSTVSTSVTLKAKLRRVSGKEAPEDLLAAFVYAPNSGKASLREAADNDSKVLTQCTTGTVVTVLEIGKTHSLVEVDGQVGYLRNDCLGYSAVKEEQLLTGTLVGGGSVNVRGGADKDSYRIGQWPSGTQVTVYGVSGSWCEVEFDGVHGWVAAKYVAPIQ